MLIKSRRSTNYLDGLSKMFGVLQGYEMKLNPLTCSFEVASGKFLGFIVNARGIEINPEKNESLKKR